MGAKAQPVTGAVERLSPDRPEAWAMNYFTASSFMTGFGETRPLQPGQWMAAVELGHIPRLSEEQRQVGFSGFKQEDLNKSPVIGRLRGTIGLPGGWVAELGYTPPLEIDNTRAHDLLAAAIGRRLYERGEVSLSARVFGQHGQVGGDITCPAELAGIEDVERNPYGCRRPSDDRLQLNYYGLELMLARQRGAWQWHAGIAAVRTETEVRVDAYTYGVHDRSRLVAKDVLTAITVGTTRTLGQHWYWGAEILYVPLQVRRGEDRSSENDPLVSVRLHLRYEAD
ncbi:hypothetical protein ASD14_12685 [Lysobacter sp. Root494]|nr:hypothetical protein ASD14_12685 [Lysobacter sp. Root494]